jgi:DNA-binding XRE family transcriptional regulator
MGIGFLMWTDESRLKASAKAAARWRQKVLSDPNASQLARARAFRAITQRELSGLSGVSVSAIVAAESHAPISPSVQERLSVALGLPELFA